MNNLLIYYYLIAEHIETKKLVAIKTEDIDTPYPMVIYEANVTLLLQGVKIKKKTI
jgi:hypothetical protein